MTTSPKEISIKVILVNAELMFELIPLNSNNMKVTKELLKKKPIDRKKVLNALEAVMCDVLNQRDDIVTRIQKLKDSVDNETSFIKTFEIKMLQGILDTVSSDFVLLMSKEVCKYNEVASLYVNANINTPTTKKNLEKTMIISMQRIIFFQYYINKTDEAIICQIEKKSTIKPETNKEDNILNVLQHFEANVKAKQMEEKVCKLELNLNPDNYLAQADVFNFWLDIQENYQVQISTINKKYGELKNLIVKMDDLHPCLDQKAAMLHRYYIKISDEYTQATQQAVVDALKWSDNLSFVVKILKKSIEVFKIIKSKYIQIVKDAHYLVLEINSNRKNNNF